ncbi:flavodoxin [Dactylosporangium sp. AC04546]|uniref:flavodoxin n=1 Tax=Dactylosporangium sp. AC04546 TaxID=2862460 RepID=UPI001EE0C7CD|nr:flavodoxin [Dactylosporangium sp. AC04546]WVK80500.1 flavodoxin [Dactylosporangium sp. AC04546]
MNRRAVLHSSLLLGGGVLLNAATAACGSPTSAPPGTQTTAAGAPAPGSSPPRVLLAYFSRAGENYWYGGTRDIEVGNTQVVADMIASLARVDVHRIQAADPYPHSYRATVDRNVAEQNADARPAITGTVPDMTGYDVVLLGSGIWNVRPPMIMRTFAGSADLTGKTIHPFVTYAVSGLGRTIEDYTELCPDSTIGNGLAVRGEQAPDAQPQVERWLSDIGLR